MYASRQLYASNHMKPQSSPKFASPVAYLRHVQSVRLCLDSKQVPTKGSRENFDGHEPIN